MDNNLIFSLDNTNQPQYSKDPSDQQYHALNPKYTYHVPESQYAYHAPNPHGLNDISIPYDIIDQFGGSTDPIDLEDVHDDADTQTTIGSSTKRKTTKRKAKCWQHFELVPTDKLVNGVHKFKAQCKHCQDKFAWHNGIDMTHLNGHFKKCQYKHEGLDTNQAQLQFGPPRVGSSNLTLNNWIYSQELM
ncbi:Uncharacterized protein Adt_12219 [Abeliophyllum distichum]|uniref:BED-type domain-containing protein n=1 Tax=Abeliophyllum distichum TaxID=126358 RepID=A0ABD1URJ8_9LAMI